ncbi:hypothetical protein F1188_04975 [Roseospira marina]|uniref:Uncharacterized protein n=1 Tax=Roseospira marina TaxID=140057 RepID=A0A5M6IFH8_9PROT|nr:hypothetical protein [Roseospira marina]KAA5606687.1 hypothetical protein F1188_04975 [Roseospira marina]MBB4313901.1 hypothetical protein [Roseospira marina]MBB5087063.1 hypothetical protein [Roseospira marina]
MHRPSRDTLISYIIGAALIVPMILPVLDNIEEGRRLLEVGALSARDRLRPNGLGPVSGLMLYVFATPIAITLSRTLRTKLVMIAGLVVLSLAVSSITTTIEQGDVVLGLSAAWLTLATVAAIALLAWRHHAHGEAAMRKRAEDLVAIVRDEVDQSRVSSADQVAAQVAATQDDDFRDVDLAEKMALAAIWQSAVDGGFKTFDRRVLRALASVRSDMSGNASVDPHGLGLAVLDRIVDRARRHLRQDRPRHGNTAGYGTPQAGGR